MVNKVKGRMDQATKALQDCLETIISLTEPQEDLKTLLPPQDFDFISLIDAPLPYMGQVHPIWEENTFKDYDYDEEGAGSDVPIKSDDLVPNLFSNAKGGPKFPTIIDVPQDATIKPADLEKIEQKTKKKDVKDEDKPGLIADKIIRSICSIMNNYVNVEKDNNEKKSFLKRAVALVTTSPKTHFENFLNESRDEFSNAFFKISRQDASSGVFSFFLIFKLVTHSFM